MVTLAVRQPGTAQWPSAPLSKYSLFTITRNLYAPGGTPTSARPCASVVTQLTSFPFVATTDPPTPAAGSPLVPVTVTSTFVTVIETDTQPGILHSGTVST